MRLFTEHTKRQTFSLDGVWEFAPDETNIGEREEWYRTFPTNSCSIVIPSCINHRLGYMEFASVAWYKKNFFAEGAITITFGAVTEYAKVYLDGDYLGDHYGGFTAFSFDAQVKGGMHTLVVRVDAHSTEDTIPLWAVDWHHYCGILRSVEVSRFTSIEIRSMRAQYTLSENLRHADLNIRILLRSRTAQAYSTNLHVCLEGEEVFCDTVTVFDTAEVCIRASVENVRLWDTEHPELYTLTAQTEDDDLIDRIGFRKIEVQGKQILLNGMPVKIMGVNRHEEHPDWGFAMPAQLNIRDMDILKDLGVNAVRGSHYPNSQLFVDLCDSAGILFWSEIPRWGFERQSLSRPLVMERGLRMHTEMVEQYFNHPSIVIWGMHNEIATDTEEGRYVTEMFINHVRSLDSSRLVTYATNRILKDQCLDLPDFISVNQYVGWYEGNIEDWPAFIMEMKRYLKENGVENKPVLISEFGVGAMFGTKTFEELRWSENYQVNFYRKTLELFLLDPDLSGVLLWQFADIRSNAKWSLLRARSFNNKGLVNEYRQPKLAYYEVKETFERERNQRGGC